jgi:hypothetical protein
MADAKLDLTVQSFTANQLAIKVKNISGAALDEPMKMEITFPKVLLSQDISDQADKASKNDPPIATVDDYVKGTEGKFSVWAEPETSDHFVTIMFFNDLDKDGAEISPMILTDGAEFTILIPLNPTAHRITIYPPYGYEYNAKRVDGTLELKVEESDWTPEVTLTTDQANPTAIEPMTEVKIKWEIKNGVSAVLRGPLPGGNTEWSLSNSPTSNYKMSNGSFVIKAVGSMTYMLQAEVKGPSGKPNMQVAKMLSLDIRTTNKYGYLSARPSRVLPFGLVELDWAAWGVNFVRITAPGSSREFKLTDMTLSGFAQGTGVVRTTARKTDIETQISANLYIEIQQKMQEACEAKYTVIPWTKLEKPKFTGKPLGLAVAAPKMALLTTDGLWIAEVGEYDTFDGDNDLDFTKPDTDKPKAWLAIATLGDKFVVLRQTDQNDLQVALYKSNGTPDEIPPLDLKPLMGSSPVFDFVVYRNRAYVAVESLVQNGRVRSAFSVGFDNNTKRAEYRNELLLERLPGYRLLTFDDALFALDRESGQMLRLDLKDDKLEPYKAASAVNQQGASMVKQGLLVPVGRVLAVLSPTSVPSLASLADFGLKNVLPYKNLTPPQDAGRNPQDLVYSPLNDRWSRCGHGVDIKEGVVAFRGGESPRLWVIDPNGDTYTLTVGSEDLFLPDYVKGLPSKPLSPAFNKKRELMFINNTGMQFVPMNDTCLKAGLRPFSAIGLVQLSSPLPTGSNNPRRAEPVELRYNDAIPPSTTTLRFLAQRGPGVKHEYVLEVTLSGPHFSFATIGFKRITVDAQGGVLVVEVPGKLEFPIALGLIETFPRQLGYGIRLRIRNLTPYTLWLRSPEATDPADREKKYDQEEAITIRYNTPPFSIYAHGVGELPFDVDFTLPDGIEMSPSREVQKERIRIRRDGSQAFAIESVSVQKTPEYDAYEFTLRYKVEKSLSSAYLGDGVPSNDGASIYLPVAEPPNVTNAKILKIDANNLQTTAQASVPGRNIFSCPNSVAVLSDIVVAILNREDMSIFDHELKSKPGLPIALFEYDIITNLKGSPSNSIFLMGMKEQPTWQFKYSYKIDWWSFSEHLRHDLTGWLYEFRSYRPGRVPGAPPWVAPNTISFMDVRPGAALAICVEGGIIGNDVKNNWSTLQVELPGTGREEAILVDPTEHLVFCAHSKPSGPGLMISRINLDKPSEKLTIEIPGPVTHMVTDPRPVTGPNLEYHRARAVSLRATSDTLFVSHARRIYVLDKTKLTERQNIALNLPVRLIQARRGKPPGENHPKYGVPQDCYFVWAIGSRYAGDGQTVKVHGQDFETSLYKIAILQ